MIIIDIYIVTTLFIVSFFYINKRVNFVLLVLLILAIINEVVTKIVFRSSLNMTIYSFFHNILWYYILYLSISHKKIVQLGIISFICFGLVNFIFLEGQKEFNFTTFIFGAFIYISIFIYESFYQLKEENLSFFKSNNYLLLFSPVLFFFGLSFVFGFKSRELAETVIFRGVKLYDFIIYFVNIIYYTLINIYIYREKRLKHAG